MKAKGNLVRFRMLEALLITLRPNTLYMFTLAGLLTHDHGLMPVVVPSVEAQLDTVRKISLLGPARCLSPGTHANELTDGSFTPLRVSLQNYLVHLSCRVTAQVRVEERGQVGLELVGREDEQGHRLLELLQELLVTGSARGELLLSKVDGCCGIISSGIADELYKLQP